MGLPSYAIVFGMTIQPEYAYPAWTLGDRIRKARSHVHMTQGEFAERIGAKEGSLAAWETDRAQPRNVVAVAKRIEALTRIPAAWILGLESDPPPPGGGGGPSLLLPRLDSNQEPSDSCPAGHQSAPEYNGPLQAA